MKRKPLGKKLVVSPQTLRILSAPELSSVAGGAKDQTRCSATCWANCQNNPTATGCPTCA